MTVTNLPRNPISMLQELEKRTYNLEQRRSGGSGSSEPGTPPRFPDGYYVGPDNEYVGGTSPPPSELVLTWGSYFDEIYIQADWEAPTGPEADQISHYEAELTEIGEGVVDSGQVGGTSHRFNGVKPNQEYSVRVRSISRIGKYSNYLGPEFITTGADATQPGQVQNLEAKAGQKTVVVYWDENNEEDVRWSHGGYDVELDTNQSFTGINKRTIRTSATIVSFGDLITGVTYWARARAFDSSGNFGPYSLPDSATPSPAQGGDIGDGEMCNDHICADGISAAHIKFGEMEGDRIKANTINANRMMTSELDAARITLVRNGMLRAGRQEYPYHYSLYDPNGFRGYRFGSSPFTGGELIFDINIENGSAYFKGDIGSGSSIYAPYIHGGEINGVVINGKTINGTRINGSEIHGTKIYGGEIHGTNIFAGTIRAATIIASNITASYINGGEIIASIFRSAISGERVEIDPSIDRSEIRFYPSDDVEWAGNVDADGSSLWVRGPSFGAGDTFGQVAIELIGAGGPHNFETDRVRMWTEIMEVMGGIRIKGGDPQAGRVLTALGNDGSAHWADPTGGGGLGGGLFIQSTQPTEPGPWLWVDISQTPPRVYVEDSGAS